MEYIFSFKEYALADKLLTLMLVYTKKIYENAPTFSAVITFTMNKFHKYYSRGFQM